MTRQASQSRRMGPREKMDWEFKIQNLIDRITALENNNRSQAQRTSDIQGAINAVDTKVSTAVTNLQDYKKFVTSRFEHVGTATETHFHDTDAKINDLDANSTIIENHFVIVGGRLDSMDIAMTRMMESMRALQAVFTTQGMALPQMFNMSMPSHPPQQPQPTAEAPGLNMFSGCSQPEPPAACGGRPLCSYPDNLPRPAQPGIIPTAVHSQAFVRHDGLPRLHSEAM